MMLGYPDRTVPIIPYRVKYRNPGRSDLDPRDASSSTKLEDAAQSDFNQALATLAMPTTRARNALGDVTNRGGSSKLALAKVRAPGAPPRRLPLEPSPRSA